MFRYQITRSEDLTESVVVSLDTGQMLTASSTHPNYRRIVGLLVSERSNRGTATPEDLSDYEFEEQALQQKLIDLFDASIAIGTKFDKLSERVRVAGGTVFFDGVPVNTVLAEQILKFHKAGLPFMPLVNFFEKIAQNPNPHSQETAYNWLQAQGNFTITDDGDLIAYKGLRADRTSVTAGPGIVDGVYYNGHLPNEVGSVVEMARDKVNHDPMQGCSVGLHAGTFGYASTFGHGICSKVQINPRDIVSVPTDCGAQKMRVCRYLVLENTEVVIDTPLYGSEYDEYDEDDDYGIEDAFEDLDDIEESGDEIVVPAGSLKTLLGLVRDMSFNGKTPHLMRKCGFDSRPFTLLSLF